VFFWPQFNLFIKHTLFLTPDIYILISLVVFTSITFFITMCFTSSIICIIFFSSDIGWKIKVSSIDMTLYDMYPPSWALDFYPHLWNVSEQEGESSKRLVKNNHFYIYKVSVSNTNVCPLITRKPLLRSGISASSRESHFFQSFWGIIFCYFFLLYKYIYFFYFFCSHLG
jgi:hypothetical protein